MKASCPPQMFLLAKMHKIKNGLYYLLCCKHYCLYTDGTSFIQTVLITIKARISMGPSRNDAHMTPKPVIQRKNPLHTRMPFTQQFWNNILFAPQPQWPLLPPFSWPPLSAETNLCIWVAQVCGPDALPVTQPCWSTEGSQITDLNQGKSPAGLGHLFFIHHWSSWWKDRCSLYASSPKPASIRSQIINYV